MNANLDKNILNDIFHYLGRRYIKENNIYKFPLYPDKKNPFKVEYYKVKKLSSIPDPSIDSNFKAIFNNHSKRLENLLNSIYFEPNDMKISELVFINNEYNAIGQAYNLNTLRSDIACKGKITINDGEQKELLLDVEIQINWIEELDDKLFEYGTLLRNNYSNELREKQNSEQNKKKSNPENDSNDMVNTEEKEEEEEEEEEEEDEELDLGEIDDQEIISRVQNKTKKNKKTKKRTYLDTLVLAFILGSSSNNSNVIKLTRDNGKNKFIDLKKFKIVEINTFNEWNKIENNKENYLFGKKLSKDGEDWIKFISLREWAKKNTNKIASYYFPPLELGHKYSTNEYINKALNELIIGNKIILTMYKAVEDYLSQTFKKKELIGRKKGIKQSIKKGIKQGIEQGIKQGIEQGIKQGINKGEEIAKNNQLHCAYIMFINLNKIDNSPLDYKYKLKDIPEILKKIVKPELYKDENIKKFIEELKKRNAIEN